MYWAKFLFVGTWFFFLVVWNALLMSVHFSVDGNGMPVIWACSGVIMCEIVRWYGFCFYMVTVSCFYCFDLGWGFCFRSTFSF